MSFSKPKHLVFTHVRLFAYQSHTSPFAKVKIKSQKSKIKNKKTPNTETRPLFPFLLLRAGFRYLEFFYFWFLIFDFWFWPLFFDFVLCLLCYLAFVFFHLVNYLTTTFIRNSLNSLVLLNLFIYGLLYFTFVLLYIICVCICYFA